jgi:bacteriocin-like protein
MTVQDTLETGRSQVKMKTLSDSELDGISGGICDDICDSGGIRDSGICDDTCDCGCQSQVSRGLRSLRMVRSEDPI